MPVALRRTVIAAAAMAVSALGFPHSLQAASPSQGHYTGTWQSSASYHFDVPYCNGLDLAVTINGSLDLTVAPDGAVSGTATGQVNAPVTDCGAQDVSSGYGTITGTVSGRLDSQLLLVAPVIDMHWGTYVGGGYTVDQPITMPNYTFTVSSCDCVSSLGTIAETNFPTEYVVADAQGSMVQAPGIGTATGQWSVQSDQANTYPALSQQINNFMSRSNTLLSGPVTYGQAVAQILGPLSSLQDGLPDCLHQQLQNWRTAAAQSLLERAVPGSTIASLRLAGDLTRIATALDPQVGSGAGDTVTTQAQKQLDAALSSGDWSQAALIAREQLLLEGASQRPGLQKEIDSDLHARLAGAKAPSLRETARVAYLFGDTADATKAAKGIIRHSPHPKKHHRTIPGVLHAGIQLMHPTVSGQTLSWRAVSNASQYVVVASSGRDIAWSWTGSATAATFGDTALDGVDGSAADGWTISAPDSVTWTVLALNAQGKIVGIALNS